MPTGFSIIRDRADLPIIKAVKNSEMVLLLLPPDAIALKICQITGSS